MRALQWAGSRECGSWWFRVFGWGLLLKAPWSLRLFSERNGLWRFVPLGGGWRVRVLSRDATWKGLQ